jgi:hypothetical protein
MKKMIFAAAALAAGLTTIAAHAENRDTYQETIKREQALRSVDETTTASIPADKAPRSTKATVAAKTGKGGSYSAIISKYASQHGVPVALGAMRWSASRATTARTPAVGPAKSA